MPKPPKSDSDRVLGAIEDLRKMMQDLFILQASLAGVGQREIRAMLGVDIRRVARIAKHAKREEA